ncbi:hypothetical protein ACIP5Y_40540 [Nocardia sp. NPDC088792]|uniref:hypothetical protein n=1 Tax=Nocardia sp. NPDC088792 TaxID=3364332 RepID=UPI00380B9714
MTQMPRDARRSGLRRTIAALAAGGLLLSGAALTGACDSSTKPADPAQADRGRVVRADHLLTLTPDQVKARMTDAGFDTSAVRFAVDTYRLVYATVDPAGKATTATGLLAVPAGSDHELTAVMYEHGTMATKSDAPSVSDQGGDLAATLTFAGAGFAGVAPDYLGLGLGPGTHPYMDVPSETTASVDMLRAARSFVSGTGRQLRDGVDIMGFSEGGPASLGVARAMQDGAADAFRARAVAAVSGPFDVQNAEFPAMSGQLNPGSSVFYSAYFLVAWNRLHQLYNSPSEVFRAPYDGTVEQLFDGNHSEQDIVAGLPASLDLLLTPHATDMLNHPSGRLADALRIADGTCADWTPQAAIRLYTGNQDGDVATANSDHCQADFHAHGADAQRIDLGALNHDQSGIAGTAAAARWFLELPVPQ